MTTSIAGSALREQGGELLQRGLPVAAIHVWTLWRSEASAQGDSIGFVQASNALAGALGAMRDHRGAHRELRAALGMALDADIPGEDRAKIHLNLALNLYRRGDLEGALAAGLEAWEICNLGAGLRLAGIIQTAMAGIRIGRGEWAEAAKAARAAGALGGLLHDATLRSRALNNLAMVQIHEGRSTEAEEALAQAIALSNDSGHQVDLPFHYTELAHAKLRAGETQAALEHATQALDTLWTRVGVLDEAEVARLSRLFGLVAAATRDRDQAIVWLNRAAAYYAQSGLLQAWQEVGDRLAEVLAQPDTLRRERHVQIPTQTRDRLHYLTSLLSLSDSISSAQPQLGLHSALVTHYALRLGDAMGVSRHTRDVLSHAGRFHDIGKIVVKLPPLKRREDVIGRPNEERTLSHPRTGEEMLAMFPLPRGVTATVRAHHERWDGTGYPDGLAGAAIPRPARILAVANLYVALTTDVHPTPALSHPAALAVIRREMGHGLDPEAAAAFLRLHEEVTSS